MEGETRIKMTDESKLENLNEGEVNMMPCCIKHNGPSPVSHYFKPKPLIRSGVDSEGMWVFEAFFRGRRLYGATLPVPATYSGFVLGKKRVGKRKASENSESDCWEANAVFKSIMYWNHDTLPSQDDVVFRSFHWLPVAEALHKPVTVEELASVSVDL